MSKRFGNLFGDFLTVINSNLISLFGAIISTTSAFLFIIFVGISTVNLNNYTGIIGFLIIPGFFVLGLLLVPAGFFIYRRKVGFKDLRDVTPSRFMEKLKIKRPQGIITLILFLTVINIVILGASGYQAFHYMESNVFCGTLCHTVMTPEYTAYKDSSHSRVPCVDCHIGAGADWFVKSKLSGLRQVFAVMTNSYHKPIQTPLHNLRPARETCEQCHWPERFTGQRLKNIVRYADDEANTPSQSVLLLNVGSAQSGKESGIHRHVAKDFQVRYISENDKRENIKWIELTTPGGKTKNFVKEGYSPSETEKKNARIMDCIDCHNRATHTYDSLKDSLDKALFFGHIDPTLPFIRREAERLISKKYEYKEEALKLIKKGIMEFYRANYPAIYNDKANAINRSADAIVSVYARNIHPAMKVSWDTYPNHIGHEQSPGCFRCHSGELTSKEGETISNDCTLCHSLVKYNDSDVKPVAELFK